jgi:hypothetical protein
MAGLATPAGPYFQEAAAGCEGQKTAHQLAGLILEKPEALLIRR